MNESSSKYVDQIATEKLLAEKLTRVHHAPDLAADWSQAGFNDFGDLPSLPDEVQEVDQGKFSLLRFPSVLLTLFPENNQVVCRRYAPPQPSADLIFVHGLYEDNLEIYSFFISQLLAQGIRVTLMELPYHYDRRPVGSQFSGEYFWSGNLLRSALAHKQAVYDLYQTYNLLRSLNSSPLPTGICGFSMGGGIALSLASLTSLDCLFLINPVCNISELVWSSALFAPIRDDLETHGIDFVGLKACYRPYEPLEMAGAQTSPHNIFLAYSLYDQINDPGNYKLLIEQWAIHNILPYKAGHLNILRVPRLAGDVAAALLQSLGIENILERGVAE
jgi:hypothetical protein